MPRAAKKQIVSQNSWHAILSPRITGGSGVAISLFSHPSYSQSSPWTKASWNAGAITNGHGIIFRSLPYPAGCHDSAGRANLEFYRVLLNVHTYGITGGGESNAY